MFVCYELIFDLKVIHLMFRFVIQGALVLYSDDCFASIVELGEVLNEVCEKLDLDYELVMLVVLVS